MSLKFRRRTTVASILCGALAMLLSAGQQGGFLAGSGANAGDSSARGSYESTAARIKELLYNAPQARTRLLTSAGPPVDLMLHHGGAYSARERARLEGRVRDGAVLVLLDSHADLMDQVGLVRRAATVADADRIEYDIASHIVPSLADGLVTEIVHVGNRRLDRLGRLPAHVPGVRRVWVVRVRDHTGVEAAVLLDGDHPTRATALARMQPQLAQRARVIDDVLRRGQLWVEPRPRSIEDLQVVQIADESVTIRTTFPDDLPDLSDRTRSLILDIDADFFVLGPQTGPDTHSDAGEIARDVEWTLDRLAGRGMRPGSVSIALSPGYTPEHAMAPVTTALLASLERVGVSRYVRRAGGAIALDLHQRMGDALPETLALRAAIASELRHDSTIDGAIALCARVIARYEDDAIAEQRRGRARSAFAYTGNPDWPWQPSPIVVAQRELNAVAEAYAFRSDLLARRGRCAEALADRLVLEKRYSDAYRPVSVRHLSPGYGWIVGHGWMPRRPGNSKEVPICGPGGGSPRSNSGCTN